MYFFTQITVYSTHVYLLICIQHTQTYKCLYMCTPICAHAFNIFLLFVLLYVSVPASFLSVSFFLFLSPAFSLFSPICLSFTRTRLDVHYLRSNQEGYESWHARALLRWLHERRNGHGGPRGASQNHWAPLLYKDHHAEHLLSMHGKQ